MESIRIGKDIRVRWPINSSAPLDTLALRLELESPLGVRTEEAFTLEGGSVMFYYPGTRQRDPGTYALTLWANYGAEGQTAVDACHAFRLVGRTCQEAPGGEGLEISTVELPAGELAVGLQGASAYESWLATGHEGTEADFVAWLRQPSVDAAGQAGQAATKALEAAKKATEVAATLQAHDKAWGEAEGSRTPPPPSSPPTMPPARLRKRPRKPPRQPRRPTRRRARWMPPSRRPCRRKSCSSAICGRRPASFMADGRRKEDITCTMWT